VNTFLGLQVGKGGNDFRVHWSIGVVLNWIVLLLLGPNPLVTELLLSKIKAVEVLVDIVVSTEVWYSIVNLVTKVLLLMLILSATSRRANWVGCGFSVSLDIRVTLDIHDIPFVSNRFLSITKVLQSTDDFSIESWIEVVVSVLSFVLIFITSVTNHELFANHAFSLLD